MELTQKQQEGVSAFANFLADPLQKEFRLVGFSGCGKSTLTQYLINLIQKRKELCEGLGVPFNYDIQLTATTNKAAKALKDALGESHFLYQSVSTIQSYLSLVLTNNYNTGEQKLIKSKQYKVKSNVICFIDESSYISSDLLKTINESFINSKLVFIGDPDQLLPMYHESAPAFNEDPSVFLDETVRQAKGSNITDLGHAFRKVLYGHPFPSVESFLGDDVELIDGAKFQELVNSYFTSEEYRQNPNYCKIIGWTNVKIQEYNAYVRALWTPHEAYIAGEYLVANQAIVCREQTLASNESVKRILHASDVFEHYGVPSQTLTFDYGDSIVPLDYAKANHLIKSVAKDKDWPFYFQLKEEFCDYRPNHALTTHKAQGSTYDYVFLDLSDIGRNTKKSEIARLVYVASTRARKKLYLYGRLPNRLYV